MQDYFELEEKLQIDAFLQVPKILFTDKYKKMTTLSRLIYSLYLNRYITTTFKDNNGIPYIIYSDEELSKKTGSTRMSCSRAKKELTELGLIRMEKTIRFNHIYVYNYRSNTNKDYYTVEDMQEMQFYKFPHELFEDKFKKLSLNEKMLYVYYLDIITLSQIHSFADDYRRVFFYDAADTQGEHICLSARTITSARKKLFACHLLHKTQSFSKKAKYYLKKLSQYNETDLITFLELDKTSQQKDFLKKISEQEERLLEIRKNVTSAQIQEEKVLHTSSAKMLHEETQKSDFDISKEDTSNPQDDDNEFSKNVISINKTYLNNNNIIETNDDSFIQKEWNELINKLYLNISLSSLHDIYKGLSQAVIQSLSQTNSFNLYKKNELFKLNQKDLLDLLKKLSDLTSFEIAFKDCIKTIIEGQYQFATPEKQINCFCTILLNYLKDKEENISYPEWFNNVSYAYLSDNKISIPQKMNRQDNISQEIKDFNWWDEKS